MTNKKHPRHHVAFATILALSTFPTLAIGQDWPTLQWNPETIASCVFWESPRPSNDTCEHFRHMYDLSPEQFHEFNPSIGVDCSGWLVWESYCIADDVRQEELYATQTDPIFTSMRPTPTPTVSGTVTGAAGAFAAGTGVMVAGTAVPSPRLYAPAGCFPAKEGNEVLSKKMEIPRERKMTNELCQASCWAEFAGKDSFLAGLRNGNECWCGKHLLEHNALEYPLYSESHCRKPCDGDKKQYCGDEEHMLVYQAVVVYGTGLAWGMKPQKTVVVAGAGVTAAPTGNAGSAGNGQQNAATNGHGLWDMDMTLLLCMGAVAFGLL